VSVDDVDDRDDLAGREDLCPAGRDGLDDLIDRVPGWRGRARTIEPLDGGITNRNYKVTLDGGGGADASAVERHSFVVRSPGSGTALLGIDRRHEEEAARQAASLGVGPEVVALVEPEGALVTRFVDGSVADEAALRSGPLLASVAALLRTVHGGPPIAAVFDWHQVPLGYAATARAHGVSPPPAFDRAMEIADQVRDALAVHAEPACPCHNDLLAANFLLSSADGGGPQLIDWEYAGMNDRWFDLGNFAVNNGLDAEGDAALVEAYFGRITTSRLARLGLMKVISDLREAMWGVVQQAVSTLDVDFPAYAAEHFDRLLTNAADPGFVRLLTEASQADA
jgi:thiamine kinase-like enzyme